METHVDRKKPNCTRKNSDRCYFAEMPKPAYRIKPYKHPRLKFVVRSKNLWQMDAEILPHEGRGADIPPAERD